MSGELTVMVRIASVEVVPDSEMDAVGKLEVDSTTSEPAAKADDVPDISLKMEESTEEAVSVAEGAVSELSMVSEMLEDRVVGESNIGAISVEEERIVLAEIADGVREGSAPWAVWTGEEAMMVDWISDVVEDSAETVSTDTSD
jgi:hypothetical protein